ncbi:MAG: hypothetical protein DSY82_09485 [Flavobacteriia bacterium]|nr:MAG: hypothetical protein DSY82_09485 [Flavobacteriia bacterium]
MSKTHTFHIPVMGIGFTIDTPLKISHYGIDSVISLVDDILIEKIRKVYSEKYEIPYKEISDKIEDFRAKRITSYLNLVNEITDRKFNEIKKSVRDKSDGIKEYLSLLPDNASLKKELNNFKSKYFNFDDLEKRFKNSFSKGSIDVNIMTKLDRENIKNGKLLSAEYNDAHAALRGFANSDLSSSLVLSAGMNPRLYAYLENFDDFFPDSQGNIKKKVVLKVSDYRSALIQGKYLAKKGIWVSEYRIESGLNCGGHAFATEGYLMGPILEEFKINRKDLERSINEILVKALKNKNRVIPENDLTVLITAQGGVGTFEEHEFLLEHYHVDSVGWGSPFLLVPEVTSVDEETIHKLEKAGEEDLYLSDISPLGVPFNNLRGNTKDLEKQKRIDLGRPGSPCPKQYVALNNEFTEHKICTASRQYQKNKIKELNKKSLSTEEYKKEYDKITVKSCICVGLGTSALLNNNIDTKQEGLGVSICPGPNMAYFSKKLSLKEMVDHIYGRAKVISVERPNMFIKELNLYLDYLKNKVEESKDSMNRKQEKYLVNFSKNLQDGINYYDGLFTKVKDRFEESKDQFYNELESARNSLNNISMQIEELRMQPVRV